MLERVIQMRGTVLDVPSEEVPEDSWSYSKNVFFRDLATQRVSGYEVFYHVVGDNPVYAYPVQRISAAVWLLVVQRGADALVIRWDGTTASTLHTYTGLTALDLDWQATDLNGVIILNNGQTAPRFWEEVGGTMDELPGWPANVVCRSIRAYKYHLFAMSLTDTSVQNYYEYMWSDQADPGGIPQSWTAAPDTDSGNSQFPVEQGFIVDALPIRDSLAVYKDFSVGLVQYIGGVFVFQQRGLYITAGMINAKCVTEINGYHFVFTQDDIIKHDGNSMDSICTHEIRRYIFGVMNGESIRYCCVSKRHITDEIWFCYPTGVSTYCTEAAVYNTKTERWSFRPLPNLSYVANGLMPDPDGKATWGSRDNTWRDDPHRWGDKFYSNTAHEIVYVQPFADGVSTDGYVYVTNRGFTENGKEIEAEVKREGYELDEDPATIKYVNEIWPHVLGRDGDTLMVQVGGSMFHGGAIHWEPAVPYALGANSAGKVNVHSVGRLSSFRFYSNGGAPWRMYDFKVRYKIKGRF